MGDIREKHIKQALECYINRNSAALEIGFRVSHLTISMERTMENTISTLEEITREDGKLSMELRAKVDRFKELFVELNMMSKMPSMENTISDLEEETREHEKISLDFKAELDRVKESLVKPNNINILHLWKTQLAHSRN